MKLFGRDIFMNKEPKAVEPVVEPNKPVIEPIKQVEPITKNTSLEDIIFAHSKYLYQLPANEYNKAVLSNITYVEVKDTLYFNVKDISTLPANSIKSGNNPQSTSAYIQLKGKERKLLTKNDK
jgi:hypothetical protein